MIFVPFMMPRIPEGRKVDRKAARITTLVCLIMGVPSWFLFDWAIQDVGHRDIAVALGGTALLVCLIGFVVATAALLASFEEES